MAEVPASNRHGMCEICNQHLSKYCCPACEMYYCSVECYKSEKHSNCSEEFYRKCVTEELGSLEVESESVKNMNEILKQFDSNSPLEHLFPNIDFNVPEHLDSDDDSNLDINERVQGINLNDPDELWEVLTVDEQNEFEALVSSGDVGSIIPEWEPWWMYSRDGKIQDIEEENKKEEEAMKKCPPLKKVQKLSLLTSVKPSPAIANNIVNLLASYAFLARYFNGELDPVETSVYLFQICENLDTNRNFDDLMLANESVHHKCLQSEFITTNESSLRQMRFDTFLLLQGPSYDHRQFYCKSALSHLHSILTETKNIEKSPTKEKVSPIKDNCLENDKNSLDCGDKKSAEDILSSTNGKVSPDCDNETKNNEKNDKAKENTKKKFSKKFADHKKENLPKLDMDKLKKSIKKIEYYLSFLEDHGMEMQQS